MRRQAGWPPYRYLAILRVEASDRERLDEFMKLASESGQSLVPDGVLVYDPVPALLQRKAGQYRYQILVQSDERGPLQGFLRQWRSQLNALKTGNSMHWVLEIDPLDC